MFTACNKPVDRSYNVWLCHNISLTTNALFWHFSKVCHILPNLLPTYFIFIINIMKVTVKAMEH